MGDIIISIDVVDIGDIFENVDSVDIIEIGRYSSAKLNS